MKHKAEAFIASFTAVIVAGWGLNNFQSAEPDSKLLAATEAGPERYKGSEVKHNSRAGPSEQAEGKRTQKEKSDFYSRGEIIFRDGSKVNLNYLSYNEPLGAFDTHKSLEDNYNSIADLADAGDIAAASFLGSALIKCKLAPRSETELNSQVEALEQDGIAREPSASLTEAREVFIPVKSRDRKATILRETFELCRGVNQKQISDYSKYLRMAADGGDIRSVNTLSRTLGDTVKSYEVLKTAWDSGLIGTGYAIARLYSLGIHDQNSNADHLSAYAYAYATNLVWGKIFEINNSPNLGNRLVDMETALNQMIGVHLSPQQTLEAEMLAFKLLSQNQKCCVGTWSRYGIHPSD